jgi:transposase
MLMLSPGHKVWVASEAVDMRKGFNTLAALVQSEFKLDPKEGQLFVFFGQSARKVKILYWDRNGFVLWYKSLAEGRFRPPKIASVRYSISTSDLNCLLEGIDLAHAQRLNVV